MITFHNMSKNCTQTFQSQNACEWKSTLEQLEQKLPCVISSCMFEISDTEEDRHDFYIWAKLAPTVSKWIDKYCNIHLDQR
jgi:hypothetical protein